MARKNSLILFASRVTVEAAEKRGVIVTISNPESNDLIRIISEASSLLDWRRRREIENKTL